MFAILFQFICCWPSWKSKTTTRVRPLSQADRARQLYVTLSARAHSLTLSHTYTHWLFPDNSLLLGYSTVKPALIQTILCVCVHQFSVHVLRARKALGGACLLFYVCICVFVILTSVSPLICRDSAVLMKAGRASCLTFTSPQYINCIRSFSAEWLTLFKKTKKSKTKLVLLSFTLAWQPHLAHSTYRWRGYSMAFA